MEKLALNSYTPKSVTIEYLGQSIIVQPYIPIALEKQLISNYIDSLFKDDNFIENYIEAEYGLGLNLVGNLSNVEVVNSEGKVILIDDLLSGGLLFKIQDKISNYDSFRFDLDNIIEMKKDQLALDKSMGVIFDKLVSKIVDFLDSISKLDLSQEGIKQLTEQLRGELKNLNDQWGPTKI